LLKLTKKLAAVISALSLVFAIAQFTAAPANAVPPVNVEVHPWCWSALSTSPDTSTPQVINVQPGDVVRFLSYESRNNPCTTSSWDSASDLNGLFSAGPAAGEQSITSPQNFTIAANATPGMYSGVLKVYRTDGGVNYGNAYKFLVTATRLTTSNTFDCGHNNVLPTSIYVNLDQDTWHMNTVTGYCDYNAAVGATIAGAPYYVSGSAVYPYYFKGSLGAGYSYAYYRGHDAQAVIGVFAPTVANADPTNITGTSFRANGSVTDHGVRMRWGYSTQSNISFCVSTSSSVDGNGALTCDVSNPVGSPAHTDASQGYVADGTATNITTASVADITGLTANQTYYYQIVGTNGAGVSAYGAVTSATPVPPRSAQSVTWSPNTSAMLPPWGPYTPSTSASTTDSASITYSVVPGAGTTSDCAIVNSSSPSITVTTAGTCQVRATAAQTALHFSGAKDVTFTFTRFYSFVAWAPNPAAYLPVGGIFTPSSAAYSQDSAAITYSVVSGSGDTSNCSIADASTGAINVTTPGTCTIRATSAQTARYLSASTTQVFDFAIDPDTIDIYPPATDGSDAPFEIITSGGTSFNQTNDESFNLSWDSSTGRLVAQSVSVYTGYIEADISFVSNGVSYSCTQQFGILKAAKVDKLTRNNAAKVQAQKDAAMASKSVNGKAFCTDITKLNPNTLNPVGGLTKANFTKIKVTNKSAAELKQEKKAFAALKGFNGQIDVVITRYRAWPSTMLNFNGFDGLGQKLPATIRYTSVYLADQN
jgi:hypothetical protein